MKRQRGFLWLEIFVIILIWAGLALADLIEKFTYYPVSGDLTANGVQYSDSITATARDTNSLALQSVYQHYNIDYGYTQRALYLDVLSFYAKIVVRTRATDTTGTSPTVKWWVDYKDTTGSYVLTADTQTAEATAGTTYVNDKLLGYLPITQLPAQIRIGVKSDSGRGRLRVSDSTYFEVTHKTLE